MNSRRRFALAVAAGLFSASIVSADVSYNFTSSPWGAVPPTIAAGGSQVDAANGVAFYNTSQTSGFGVGAVPTVLSNATVFSGNVLRQTISTPNLTDYTSLGLAFLTPASQVALDVAVNNTSAAWLSIGNSALPGQSNLGTNLSLAVQGSVAQGHITIPSSLLGGIPISQLSFGFLDSSFNHIAGPFSYAIDNLNITTGGGGGTPNTSDIKLVLTGPGNTLDIYAVKGAGAGTAAFGVQYASGSDTTNYRVDDQNQSFQINLANPTTFSATTSLNGTISQPPGASSVSYRFEYNTVGNFTERFVVQNLDNASDAVNDNTGTINLHVYDTPLLSANNNPSLTIGASPQALTIQNTQSVAQSVGAQFSGASITGGNSSRFHLSNLPNGVTLANGQSTSLNVAFDTTGNPLNGTYSGLVQASFVNTMFPGFMSGLGWNQTVNWQVSATVASQSGSGSAAIGAASSYNGLSLDSVPGAGATKAALKSGTAQQNTTVEMSFSGGNFSVGGGGTLVGDLLNLSGTDGDAVLLEMIVPASLVSSLTLSALQLEYNDAALGWIPATAGNHGTNVLGLYPGSKTADDALAYLSANGLAPVTALGFRGVGLYPNGDASVWAIVDHNSQFGAVVPEPTTTGLIFTGIARLIVRRRRRR